MSALDFWGGVGCSCVGGVGGRGVWVGCIREGLVGVWWGVWGVRGVLCVGCMGIGGKAWGLREGVELYGGVVVGG